MEPRTAGTGEILKVLEDLRRDVARLESRVAQLETAPAQTGRGPGPGWAPPQDRVDPETVMMISAAIAAYLGKKPHIRSIRVVGSGAWAQQGRASIQAWYSVSSNRPR
jgi:methylmalonyl-CoA carboxyltransferase 12S subunit